MRNAGHFQRTLLVGGLAASSYAGWEFTNIKFAKFANNPVAVNEEFGKNALGFSNETHGWKLCCMLIIYTPVSVSAAGLEIEHAPHVPSDISIMLNYLKVSDVPH